MFGAADMVLRRASFAKLPDGLERRGPWTSHPSGSRAKAILDACDTPPARPSQPTATQRWQPLTECHSCQAFSACDSNAGFRPETASDLIFTIF